MRTSANAAGCCWLLPVMMFPLCHCMQQMGSAPDAALIEVCHREGRALVTLDLDFANPLDFRPSHYSGIAVLRLPKNTSPEDLLQTIQTLVAGLKQDSITGQLWIVEKGRIRIYQPED